MDGGGSGSSSSYGQGRSRGGRGRASGGAQQIAGAGGQRPKEEGQLGQAPIRTGRGRASTETVPTQSAWGRAAPTSITSGTSSQSSTSTGPKATTGTGPRPSAPTITQATGRATMHGLRPGGGGDGAGGSKEIAKGAEPGGNGRGAMRGKRCINDIIRTRPIDCVSKKGTTGREVTLQANYFRALKKPNWSLYQYRVDFAPDIEMLRVRKGIIYSNKDKIGGHIFDGTVLFTTEKLQDDPLEIITKNNKDEPIKVTVKFVGVLEMTDGQSLQVLNLILRKSMEGLKLQLVGRNFFDALNKIEIRDYKLELWPGYTTSFRQHETDILLCAEIAHKVMRTETLYGILQKCIQEGRNYQDIFKKEVVGTVVLTDYNNKTYRIDDIDFKSSPNSKFSTKNGDISFVQYYKERYHLNIRDPNQPLLLSRSTERNLRAGQSDVILLIPELCRATGITDSMRSNFATMRAMSDHTRLAPAARIERLKDFNKRLFNTPASMEVLKAWQLTLDQNLVELPGRILKIENIVFGNGRKVPAGQEADWTREFRNNSMFTSAILKRWYIIMPPRCQRESMEFVKLICQAANGMRMQISEPRSVVLQDDRNNSYVTAIEDCAKNDPQLLMVVVPNNNAERYSCIKKKTCVDRAIPSQVIVGRTITPKGGKTSGLMSVATKVVIQMNCKLMGAPWSIELPLAGLMIVGFDVCHSTRDSSKSYGAMVAALDIKNSPRFYSTVSAHVKGTELSNEISMNINKALQQYRELYGTLPAKILFYRDGVGEGQLHQVIEHEVNCLKKKLEEIYKSADIKDGYKFCFIVVSKRINSRYFLNKQNPPPGTVVDDIITLPERYDFYLVSQSVRQGTVSPTSYNVIYDNMGLPADKIQILSYKLCHMYYNWSGTTRVPAVCQYAHKLAFLVGQSIHQSPSNLLEKQLYFL